MQQAAVLQFIGARLEHAFAALFIKYGSWWADQIAFTPTFFEIPRLICRAKIRLWWCRDRVRAHALAKILIPNSLIRAKTYNIADAT
jgi:hypothetical protein